MAPGDPGGHNQRSRLGQPSQMFPRSQRIRAVKAAAFRRGSKLPVHDEDSVKP